MSEQKNQNNQRQLLLGVLFIAALSILAFYTLFLTDIHLFSKPIRMSVYFPEANGLRTGDPVLLLGTRVGRVKEITPDTAAEERKRVHVILSLDRKIELMEGGKITIAETSLLGGKHVDITPGTYGGLPLETEPDGSYFGTIYKNPIEMFGDLGAILNENRGSISHFLQNLDTVSTDIKDGKGLAGKLISDDALAADAKQVVADTKVFMANAREASEKLKTGEGIVPALLNDSALKQKVNDTVDNLKQLTSDLRGQQGLLGSLIYDSSLRDRITKGIDSFVAFGEKLNQGEGTLSLLMNDKATKEQFQSVLTNLAAASDDIKSITTDVKGGQGTLGKLFKDDALYTDIRKAVGVLTRSLEDYREAAPITSFTSVLFAAF